jgi:hypothetical protein
MSKIRNVKSSWSKYLGTRVKIYCEDSAWDGAGELLEPYVIRVTNKGVWFGNDFGREETYYWVNFKKIKAYGK